MWNLIDSVIRIKNAYRRSKLEVSVKYSKFIYDVLACLRDEGYIRGLYKKNNELIVLLKYRDNKPVISNIEIVSKPSKKVYYSFNKLKKNYIKGDYLVISSSKGIFLNRECYYSQRGEGGLVLFKIY